MSNPSAAANEARALLADLAELNVLVREPTDVKGADGGPLAGRPIVVKANIAVAGLPHCGATPALASNIAASSATTVQRLLDAGATVVGQTNMHELALGITSGNAHHGQVGNPHDPSRMAMGSSGGSAAAVGGGAVDMALGSDTGGVGATASSRVWVCRVTAVQRPLSSRRGAQSVDHPGHGVGVRSDRDRRGAAGRGPGC